MNSAFTKAMSPWQFTLFRVSLGLYLFWHLLQLLPWGVELFSTKGLLPSAALNPTHGLFASPLSQWGSPSVVTAILGIGILASALFTLGWGPLLDGDSSLVHLDGTLS